MPDDDDSDVPCSQSPQPEIGVIALAPYLKRKREKDCPHTVIEVDDEVASLSCEACGAEIDPWSYLRELASHEHKLFDQFKALRAEYDGQVRRANERITRLNTEITRLREIKYRLGNEQVAGAPLASFTRRARRRQAR